MSECPHKELKKQIVGEFVYYACECGQKFRIEAWDGKVSVLAPRAPRKDLAALEELVDKWSEINKTWADSACDCQICYGRKAQVAECAMALKQRLAEMRGAKR